MTQFISSADGTRIGFEDLGPADAPAVIYVHGATAYRAISPGPAALSASGGLRVVAFDRRGRGESGDAEEYAVDREIEDIAALVDHVGGNAILLGESSGAVLALEAALAGVPVAAVAAFEPPYIVDDARPPIPKDYIARLDAFAADGDRLGALRYFSLEAVGLPPAMVDQMLASPFMAAVEPFADTLRYDARVMGDTMAGDVDALAAIRAAQRAGHDPGRRVDLPLHPIRRGRVRRARARKRTGRRPRRRPPTPGRRRRADPAVDGRERLTWPEPSQPNCSRASTWSSRPRRPGTSTGSAMKCSRRSLVSRVGHPLCCSAVAPTRCSPPPGRDRGDDAPLARQLNAMPKIVVSSTVSAPTWHNTEVTRFDDLAALKESGEGRITVAGSIRLVESLIASGLLDELRILSHPVILGRGRRLFDTYDGPRVDLDLVETRTFERGVQLTIHRPTTRNE